MKSPAVGLQDPLAVWPVPEELEGVKSRKRPVFEVPTGQLRDDARMMTSKVSGIALALESRIAAVGDAGRAVAELLLGARALASGRAVRHAGLRAVHLGPHLVRAAGASADDHLAAAAGELARRPQAVVLDEGGALGSGPWSQAFHQLLGSDALRSFRGALVVCVAEETAVTRRVCSQRWLGAPGVLWQESIADNDFEVLEDVLGGQRPDAGADELRLLVEEARALFWQEPFVEDIVELAQEKGWAMTLLTEAAPPIGPEGSPGARRLGGVICHSRRPRAGVLNISRLAVPESIKKRGNGTRLMRWVLNKAALMPRSSCSWISVSALDEAMPFYERFGFCDMTCDDLDDEDHCQTQMELKNFSVVDEPSE